MPVFQYKALNAKGDATQGVVDADTAKEAREKLRLRSIYVTEMAAVNFTGLAAVVVPEASRMFCVWARTTVRSVVSPGPV